MNSIPKNITSYDTGKKPFKHDVSRGKWSSLKDFYCACVAHGFTSKNYTFLSYFIFYSGGATFVIPYIIGMIFFAIPVFFIQSFLGQFSSSGFISAFRVSPIFQGIGYLILWLNLITACAYAILAAFPLAYFFGSLNPTLPWMTCNNSWNSDNCTVLITEFTNETEFYEGYWSSAEYFHHGVCQFGEVDEFDYYSISWHIAVASIFVWILVGAIILQGVEKMGQILRYFTILIFSGIIIIFVRALFLPGAMTFLLDYFSPRHVHLEIIIASPLISVLAFGSGWGTILTLASFNNFNEDIGKYSIIICVTNCILLVISSVTSHIISYYLHTTYNYMMDFYYMEDYYFAYASVPFFFGKLFWSNLWSIIFFLTIFLGELSGCVVQIFSILTAVFDEHLPLRIYKKECTIVLLTILMIISLFFSSNYGIFFTTHIFKVSGGLAAVICFIELMMVVWVYGRLRFQRDVQFMLNQTYATWRFYLLRFITPLFILLLGLIYTVEIMIEFFSYTRSFIKYAIILKTIPILFIPIYFYWKLRSTTGNFAQRFKKLCRPTDWYPADPVDQRNYDDLLNASVDSNALIDDIDLGDIESS